VRLINKEASHLTGFFISLITLLTIHGIYL